MTDIRRAGDVPAVGREAALLLEKVRRHTLEGKLPERDDILTLLSWGADSPQAALLGKTARHMARTLAGNRGKVWAAIGVDCVPCPMDCAFCAFGQSRGIVRRARCWSGEEVALAAAAFAAAGASWVVLRKITIPMVMPSITICTFLTLTNSFKLFDQNLALTGGQPYIIQSDGSAIKTTEMLALNIYNTFYGQNVNSRGTAQAKAVLFFLLVAAIGLIQLRATRKKEVQQ